MSVLRCRICGEPLEIKEGDVSVLCSHCKGEFARHMLPPADSFDLINKGHELRNSYKFDEAVEVFEKLVSDDPNNLEALLGLILSKMGIVFNNLTGEKIPIICNEEYTPIDEEPLKDKLLELAEQQGVKELYELYVKLINDTQTAAFDVNISDLSTRDVLIFCRTRTEDDSKSTKDMECAESIVHYLGVKGYRATFVHDWCFTNITGYVFFI